MADLELTVASPSIKAADHGLDIAGADRGPDHGRDSWSYSRRLINIAQTSKSKRRLCFQRRHSVRHPERPDK